MESQLLIVTVALACLFLGIALTLVFTRSRVAASFEQGKAVQAVELATLTERVRSADAERAENARLRTEQLQLSERLAALEAQLHSANQFLSEAKSELERAMVARENLELQHLQLSERTATLDAQLIASGQQLSAARQELDQTKLVRLNLEAQQLQSSERTATLEAQLKATTAQLEVAHADLNTVRAAREQLELRANRLSSEVSELQTRLNAERDHAEEKLALLTQARDELSNQFKSLANDILEEKSKRFAEQNQTNLGQILTPLRDRITEFKTRVEEIHLKDSEQQATLKAELAQLKDLNRQMTEEAHGLATALKGQSKMQGNWGELVLGNVLDRSGLREDHDYRREVSFNTDEGRKRPDVVIYLPQSKHLVVDAKVSLNAYTRYVNAEDDVVRQQALSEHVKAIADRISELANRSYFELPGLNTPEMVFMFIPIESAFVEAMKADESLFQKAIERNVLVATPTTLLTSLNIVRQLWRFEEQNSHTAELAESASKVYKKLVVFLSSMESLGSQLARTRDTYDKAMGQLVAGKGNLIKLAQEFERTGVAVQGSLPEQLVEKALLELESGTAGFAQDEPSARSS